MLQAAYAPETYPCRIRSYLPMLMQCLHAFSSAISEISLHATPTSLRLASYVDESGYAPGTTLTTLALDPKEFSLYNVPKPVEVTFSLKDLRAIAAFCENLESSVDIYFDQPGTCVRRPTSGGTLAYRSPALRARAQTGGASDCIRRQLHC